MSSSATASSSLRKEKLTELNTCVQTLSSHTEQYEVTQSQTESQARNSLEQQLKKNRGATEECSGVVAQAQSAFKEGVGCLEKVHVNCLLMQMGRTCCLPLSSTCTVYTYLFFYVADDKPIHCGHV